MRLAPIDASNWRDAAGVTVDEDQVTFVADWQPVALVILAKSYVGDGDRVWDPVVIHDDADRIVGVAGIAVGASGHAELLHLAIDRTAQRHGLGGRAVGLIVERLTASGVRQLELTVHADNAVAQRLYRRAGFEPTGQQRHSEPVWRLRLPPAATTGLQRISAGPTTSPESGSSP